MIKIVDYNYVNELPWYKNTSPLDKDIKDIGKYINSIEISFIFSSKIILICNEIPLVDKPDDEAFWARCRCINFPIKFTDKPDKDKLNEKQIDKTLDKQIPLWKNDFMLLLIEYYKKYKNIGLIPTNNVLKFTKQYVEENDIYKDFVDQYIQVDINETIKWTTLESLFNIWYKKEKNSSVNGKEIKKYMENNVFKNNISLVYNSEKQKIRGWKGYKLKNDEYNDI
jgi:phage/plasmid-associated DNA primase